jgi:hypothetical protein
MAEFMNVRNAIRAFCIVLLGASSASVLTSPVQANTAENQVKGEAIRKLISGKRIYLAAPLGGEFPLFYQPDGRVDGTGEALGIGRLIRPTDSGRWWIAGDRMCQRWQTWYDGRTICFTLYNMGGGKLRWNQDNGDTGIARLDN